MKEAVTSITDEILTAHTQALSDLAEAAKEPEARTAFRLLFRCLETWELELLTSHVGRGIELTTFATISGGLASFRLVKDLLFDLGNEQAVDPEKAHERGKRFTQALLGQRNTPV